MANKKIRQEINILNREYVNPSDSTHLDGLFSFDPADYNGETVYLEMIAKNDHVGSDYIKSCNA